VTETALGVSASVRSWSSYATSRRAGSSTPVTVKRRVLSVNLIADVPTPATDLSNKSPYVAAALDTAIA
jgi:hypothetical protein